MKQKSTNMKNHFAVKPILENGMETGHLRLYLSVNTPLGIKRVRLHTYYNIEPREETEITAQFRNNNPQLDGTQLQSEFCYRVERHI